MNKILKSLVSGFTSLSMCAVCMISIPATADEYENIETQATNRTLSVNFMGRGSTPNDASPGKAGFSKDDVNLTNPLEFWVGIGVENVNDLPLFTDGVYSLDVAFEYDPNYVKPYWDKTTASSTAEQSWNDELVKGNLSSTGDSSAWWDDTQYEITSVRECDIDTALNDRENSTEAAQRALDGWKMCYVGVVFKGDSLLRFKDLASNSKQYLLKLPFVLLSAPDETAADQNPTVLSMVRGGDTFAIGSGSDGTNPYASWFATTHPAPDDTNLKNLFDFSGDISLFGTNDAIDNIVAVKPGETPSDPGATPSPDTTYYLSSDKTLQEDKFKAETKTYYVSVPNETEQIRMDVSSSEKPTVTVNSASVNVTASDAKKYSSDLFDLAELDKTVNDGYNNTVTITAGGTTYTVYIRRLLKPKITLNYGNSPYGEIMKASNIADSDKQAAKDAFNVKNKYDASYLPSDVASKQRIIYTLNAWGKSTDPEVNMDRNDYALFVYEQTDFSDPGYTATDSLGEPYDVTQVQREIKVCRLSGGNISENVSAKNYEVYTIVNEPSNYLFTQITSKSKKFLRPDIYDLKYSFYDSVANETVECVRKIIVIPKMSDTNMDGAVNTNDIAYVKIASQGGTIVATNVPERIKNLFLNRVFDGNYDTAINTNDIAYVKLASQGKVLEPFYR